MFKASFKLGGRRWIRTIEAKRNRFTVCPLWPLGNSPLSSFSKIKAYCLNSRLQWSWWTDLNPRPADYKSAALPTELHQHIPYLTLVYYTIFQCFCQLFFAKKIKRTFPPTEFMKKETGTFLVFQNTIEREPIAIMKF